MIEMLRNLGDFDKKPRALTLTPDEMSLFKSWLLDVHSNLEHDLLATRYEVKRDYERFAEVSVHEEQSEDEEEFVEEYLWRCVRVARLEHELRQVRPVYETVAEGIEEDEIEVDMSQPLAVALWQRYNAA